VCTFIVIITKQKKKLGKCRDVVAGGAVSVRLASGKTNLESRRPFLFFFFLKLYNTSHHFVDEIHRGSFASPTLHLFLFFFFFIKKLPTAERAVEDRKKNNNYRPQLGEEKKILKKGNERKADGKEQKNPIDDLGRGQGRRCVSLASVLPTPEQRYIPSLQTHTRVHTEEIVNSIVRCRAKRINCRRPTRRGRCDQRAGDDDRRLECE
jgi:hypothetical protein